MATTSMSLRPDSMTERRMLRPMRPKPLIATRTAISTYIRRRRHFVPREHALIDDGTPEGSPGLGEIRPSDLCRWRPSNINGDHGDSAFTGRGAQAKQDLPPAPRDP